jgi:hypothetical protein
MADWDLELPIHKAKRRGIIEQRPHIKSVTKHVKPHHIDGRSPKWKPGRWHTYSRCRSVNEAQAILRKMMRTLPSWEWRYRDDRKEKKDGSQVK